jgi:pimeloyl-ACP methyl ester carboxylesterase
MPASSISVKHLMKRNWLTALWQWGLLVGVLFLAPLHASTGVPDEQARLERWDKAQKAYELHCQDRLALRATLTAGTGKEAVITELRALNDRLEAAAAEGTLNVQQLIDEGIIAWSTEPVTDKTPKAQPMPYRELRLIKAQTGAFVPSAKGGKDVDPKNYDGMIIALPGIGFSVSTARSLFEIAGTFNNGRNPGLEIRKTGKRLRMITIPMDAPLNGMAESADYSLGHPDGVMEVLRHSLIVFQTMFPGKKTFLIGRSQGGLNAFEASVRFKNLAGVIPLNSSNPDPAIVAECITRHENMAKPENIDEAHASGFSCNFHELSWLAHEDYTRHYTVLKRPSLVPSLHLMGNKDWSYPPEYTTSWRAWAEKDPKMRRIVVFNGAHNLWMRPRGEGEALFEEVVTAMTAFMVEMLGI